MNISAAHILVVDDSPLDRRLACRILQKREGFTVSYAGDGRAALAAVEKDPPDVVLTDLLMPNMDGLELVGKIRESRPMLPVVLMTAHGSEDTAVEALRKGAASYVPKRNLAADLVDTIENILTLARGERREQQVFEAMRMLEEHFVLGNDPSALPALVRHLEEQLGQVGLFDDTERIQVAVALREALVNAIYHGNLEISSKAKEAGFAEWERLAEQRRAEPPYAERRVRVQARHTKDEVTYVIRDDGAGFNAKGLPDPTDPANLEAVHGRGLMLIRTFMDEVRHNEAGNEIVLIKRRAEE